MNTAPSKRWNEAEQAVQAAEQAAEQDEQPSPPQGPQPAGGEGSPSMVVGNPGWKEWVERNGLVPAFDDDDPFDRRVRGY